MRRKAERPRQAWLRGPDESRAPEDTAVVIVSVLVRWLVLMLAQWLG